jgi:hypothetical protein
MQESHRKGVATHPDPESCVAGRKAAIEALTGAPAGRALSCEIIASGVPTLYHEAEGHIGRGASASGGPGGKGADQGEHRATDPAPDTEPDWRVARAARCA